MAEAGGCIGALQSGDQIGLVWLCGTDSHGRILVQTLYSWRTPVDKQCAANGGGKTSADLCEVFPLLIEEAVGTTSWEELPGSNWIRVSLDSVPWLPSHPRMFLWSLFLRCVHCKRERSRDSGTWEGVVLPPLPLVLLTTSTVIPWRLLDPQIPSLG